MGKIREFFRKIWDFSGVHNSGEMKKKGGQGGRYRGHDQNHDDDMYRCSQVFAGEATAKIVTQFHRGTTDQRRERGRV